jgi:hypothetical protein
LKRPKPLQHPFLPMLRNSVADDLRAVIFLSKWAAKIVTAEVAIAAQSDVAAKKR